VSGLLEVQAGFLRSIIGEGAEAAEQYVVSGTSSASARLDIYRNNVFANYRNALGEVYPVIARLVGSDFFHHAVDRYVQAHPSKSGDIHHFGQQFADFLRRLPGAAELAYLPDTAQLEWYVHEAFHAAGHVPLAVERLAAVRSEQYPMLKFVLHPGARLMHSAYPVFGIWQANQPDRDGALDADAKPGTDSLLVIQRDYSVEIERLDAGEYAFLSCLAASERFADAVERASSVAADFDVQKVLARHVLALTIVDFNLG
jgi:hypothetical protein